jgi:ADP-heptose:LPS heptosyltransferase
MRRRTGSVSLELPFVFESAMREDRERFARLRNERVLLYWPHGLGDWVHLGVLAPLLEPSNRYAVTRAGDDYVAMLDGQTLLQPLYGGTLAPSDRLNGEPAHWGLRQGSLRGNSVTAKLAPSFEPTVRAFDPTALLWTDYPETEGRTAYPYHTKMRNLARLLVGPGRLAGFDLSQPLPNALDFAAPAAVQRALDERLAAFAPPGTRIVILSRAGVSAPRKNWESAQAERFVRELRRYDSRWRIVSMDGDDFEATAGFRRLFGDLEAPFAATFEALLQRSELLIGVPAGPFHVAMASNAVAVVGIWRAHHPDWYDEPNARAAHIVGSIVRDRRFHLRPATATKPPSLRHRLSYLDTEEIPADAVLQAAIELVR